MKCFYHNDLDGKCAAFWFWFHRGEQVGAAMISIDYKDAFPMESIEPDEEVWMVDFHLGMPGGMGELRARTHNLVWIDHHRTALQGDPKALLTVPQGGDRGVRLDGVAACELTCMYMSQPDVIDRVGLTKADRDASAIPLFTRLIGDRDTWTWHYGELTRNFYAGFMLEDTSPQSRIWFDAIEAGEDVSQWGFIGEKVEHGKRIANAEYIRDFGFRCEWEGYRVLACNKDRTSSDLFASADPSTYDIMAPFVFDGKQWTVSLYSTTVDVSALAQKHGGGGHKGASGFQCAELPFAAKEKQR